MSATTKTSITIKALVNVPVQKAWLAYTNPAAVMQWNFASDDWYCPNATSDLRKGGKMKSRMEAKDGSFGFDFEATYEEVIDQKKLVYVLADGRKVVITFESDGDKTNVITTFDAESENPIEMQQSGWQAILDNYKAYSERTVRMETLYFETEIKAPVNKVATIMLGEDTYKEWTAEFNPTSRYKGLWQKGSKILFIGTDKDGNEEGMVSRIKEHIPNKFVSIEHLGMVHKGEEITTGKVVEGWAGALENYSFAETKTGTKLWVTLDSNEEFKDYFSEAWPRALKKLKQICEA
ncbi:MAG: SRPBCC domain-containing protein [Cyclobacteriaceae bacterium]|nr:SRPBCC domain-containing protein [Cyclobacteriaceae bacterium]